jgi:hypothetical protein
MIKKFESFNPYYFKLNLDQIRSMFDPIDSVDSDEFGSEEEYTDYILSEFDIGIFSDHEFNFLKNIIDKPIKFLDNAVVYRSIITTTDYKRNETPNLRIDKLKDEWYLVMFKNNWWKCDQLDGVKKCIEDNIL